MQGYIHGIWAWNVRWSVFVKEINKQNSICFALSKFSGWPSGRIHTDYAPMWRNHASPQSFVGTVPDFLWQKGFPWLLFPGPCQVSTGSNRADESPCHDGSGALAVTSWRWQSISPTHCHSVPQGMLDRLGVSAQGMQRLTISPSWCTWTYTNFYFLYFLLKNKQLGS